MVCDPALYEEALEKVKREAKSPQGSPGHKKVLAKLHSLKVGAFKPSHQVFGILIEEFDRNLVELKSFSKRVFLLVWYDHDMIFYYEFYILIELLNVFLFLWKWNKCRDRCTRFWIYELCLLWVFMNKYRSLLISYLFITNFNSNIWKEICFLKINVKRVRVTFTL